VQAPHCPGSALRSVVSSAATVSSTFEALLGTASLHAAPPAKRKPEAPEFLAEKRQKQCGSSQAVAAAVPPVAGVPGLSKEDRGHGVSKMPPPDARAQLASEEVVRPTRADLLSSGCRSVDRYRKVNRIDEGTYGVVYRAQDLETDEVVALKQLKLSAAKSEEGFPVPSLREVSMLMKLSHVNIIKLHEVVVGKTSMHVFMVMEYAEHELRALLQQNRFGVAEVKCLMQQLLRGIGYLHDQWILHRDLKTSNLLLTNGGILKVCDFNLARHFGEPYRPYTRNVITMWYRAPEILMGIKRYGPGVDMWSCGCVFAELFLRKPLFEGKAELHQLMLIFELTGVPNEESWPGFDRLPNRRSMQFKESLPRWTIIFPAEGDLSDLGLEMLQMLLKCNPDRRLSANEALEHPYFWERPEPLTPAMMPTFSDTNSTGREHRPALRLVPPTISDDNLRTRRASVHLREEGPGPLASRR